MTKFNESWHVYLLIVSCLFDNDIGINFYVLYKQTKHVCYGTRPT